MRHESILMFRLGGLGDLLIALPSIAFVRKKIPAAKLTLVGRAEYASLLQKTGVVDDVLSWERREISGLFQTEPGADGSLTNWVRGFFLALGWVQEKGSAHLEAKLRSLGIKESHFIVADLSSRVPLSRFLFDQTAAFFGRETGPEIPFEDCACLPISAAPVDSGRNRKFVVVHPGSGSEGKCWPLRNFLEIIRRLSERGVAGLIVTGEAEERLKPELDGTALPPHWEWSESMPLLELASLLARASLYLGNDSGVTHLAAACGTTVVALFLKDLEVQWKPFGRTNILSADSVSEISPAIVMERISGLLESV
jgi:ADP-heptose:LPS heptosyltransferase